MKIPVFYYIDDEYEATKSFDTVQEANAYADGLADGAGFFEGFVETAVIWDDNCIDEVCEEHPDISDDIKTRYKKWLLTAKRR